MFSRKNEGRHATAGTARSLLSRPLDAALARAQRSNERMTSTYQSGRHGTRKRALPAIALGLGGLTGLYGAVTSGVLAVNFNTTNAEFKVYSNYLDAQQAAAYLAPSSQQDGTDTGVAELGIKTAKLAGLCAIATESIPIVGTVSLKITAGDPVANSFNGTSVPAGVSTNTDGTLSGSSATNAISAANLYLNSDAISGYGNQISGLNLGQSADSVAGQAGLDDWQTTSSNRQPVAGNFGLYANQLNIAGLDASTYGLNLAGQITLPRLKLSVVPGAKDQADC